MIRAKSPAASFSLKLRIYWFLQEDFYKGTHDAGVEKSVMFFSMDVGVPVQRVGALHRERVPIW